jgi:hypothetical protein
MTHAFISYVHEDTVAAEYLVGVLRANGIEVFWDRNIPPGRRWLDVIRDAIENGDFFIPLFSRQWQSRSKTVANEELLWAREQLRRMPHERAWFVGLRIDECDVPDDPIGAGETLHNLQFIDFPAVGWRAALDRLLRAVGVANPKLPEGDPRGAGLPAQVHIVGGGIVFTNCTTSLGRSDAFNVFRGLKFHVSGGVVGRAPDGTIAAYLTTDAPNTNLQTLNEQYGLHSAVARSTAKLISSDPANPTVFQFSRRYEMKQGDLGFDITTGTLPRLNFNLTALISYEVAGVLVAGHFEGQFRAKMDYRLFTALLEGTCELRFETDYGPPQDFDLLEATLGERVSAA